VPVSKGKGKLKPVDDADLSDGYLPPMLMSSRSVHIIHWPLVLSCLKFAILISSFIKCYQGPWIGCNCWSWWWPFEAHKVGTVCVLWSVHCILLIFICSIALLQQKKGTSLKTTSKRCVFCFWIVLFCWFALLLGNGSVVIHSESPQKGSYGGTADNEVKYLSDYITRCVHFTFSFFVFC